MSIDFRSMPSDRTPGYEGLETELVGWATQYAERFPESFGGAWVGFVDGRPYAFAAFTRDVDEHRARLDSRLRVVEVDRTLAELNALLAEVDTLVGALAGVDHVSIQLHVDRGNVRLAVRADDERGVERVIRHRFGSLVDLYFARYGRVSRRFLGWRVDLAGTTITVWWIGKVKDDVIVSCEETVDEVRLTLSYLAQTETLRVPGSSGSEVRFRRNRAGQRCTASVALSEPLGGRRVVDTQAAER